MNPSDIDALPPTQYLILEVLAARWRLGHNFWSLPISVMKQIKVLEGKGLVLSLSGTTSDNIRVGLTDLGLRLCTSASYEPPNELSHRFAPTLVLPGAHGED